MHEELGWFLHHPTKTEGLGCVLVTILNAPQHRAGIEQTTLEQPQPQHSYSLSTSGSTEARVRLRSHHCSFLKEGTVSNNVGLSESQDPGALSHHPVVSHLSPVALLPGRVP